VHAVQCSAAHNIRLQGLIVVHLRAIILAWLDRSTSDYRFQVPTA